VIERVELGASPEALFDYITSIEGFQSFEGFGPIPGIGAVDVLEGELSTVGARMHVTNTDGSTHHERILAADGPRRYAIRIHDLSSQFRLLVKHVDESWDITASGTGSGVVRTFEFTLRTPLAWPLSIPLAHGLFRAAMRRHHRRLAQRFGAERRIR
jgi:hypothetical protein